MREYERLVMLQLIDNKWKDHLLSMDHLKEGIGLRAYSQRDPLAEYKRRATIPSSKCWTGSRRRSSGTSC